MENLNLNCLKSKDSARKPPQRPNVIRSHKSLLRGIYLLHTC